MGISEVVRGSDLLVSTARQLLVHRAFQDAIHIEKEEEVEEEAREEEEERGKLIEYENSNALESEKAYLYQSRAGNGNGDKGCNIWNEDKDEAGRVEVKNIDNFVLSDNYDRRVISPASSSFSSSSFPASSSFSSSCSPTSSSSTSLSPSSPSQPSSSSPSFPTFPLFYHCDLVRDPNTLKRIAKRNQNPTENESENGKGKGNQSMNEIENEIINKIKKKNDHVKDFFKEKKKIDESYTNMLQSCTDIVDSHTDDCSSLSTDRRPDIMTVKVSILTKPPLPVSFPVSISTSSPMILISNTTSNTASAVSAKKKMDSSSDMYTLRSLRERGYTPERIRSEILGL